MNINQVDVSKAAIAGVKATVGQFYEDADGNLWAQLSAGQKQVVGTPDIISIPCIADDTVLTAANGVKTFAMPIDMEVEEVRATVVTAPTVASVMVDINKASASILTDNLEIEVGDNISTMASNGTEIESPSLSQGDLITVDIASVGVEETATGLIVYLIGKRG
jgi:hypothetical protein